MARLCRKEATIGPSDIAPPEVARWFRSELSAAITDLTAHRRRQATSFAKRKSELATMQDRLLNAYLGGTVYEVSYKAKVVELNSESSRIEESLHQLGESDPLRADTALALFDWTQNAVELWRRSNTTVRREILDALCLNRALSDVTLVNKKRKPFDLLAEGLNSNDSRGDWIFAEPTIAINQKDIRIA